MKLPDRIDLTHGSGGLASARLIEHLFKKHFHNDFLAQSNDATLLPIRADKIVVSTDSHVVTPLFFPGGDIGSLAVNGTVNDVAMAGAKPLYLTAGFIIEEGFATADLERIVSSMANCARNSEVSIVAGDTKVVEKGSADGLFINTTGVGVLEHPLNISGNNAQPGDAIILNGSIGDHGVAILSYRENLSFGTTIESDCAALNGLVARIVQQTQHIHCLRDPTRGGLATSLNEIAQQSNVKIVIEEEHLLIKPEVEAACELLGLDPLYIANEGKLICLCPKAHANDVLNAMHNHPLGREARIIGEVLEKDNGLNSPVEMRTIFGSHRIIDWLVGEQLPRIC